MFKKCALAFLALAIAARAQTPVVQTMLTAGITAAQTNVAVGAALPFQPTERRLSAYAAGTAYSVGDLVLFANGSTDLSNASLYVALVAHTGAATFTADSPQGNWQLVGNAVGLRNWAGSTAYAAGQLTIENGTVIKRNFPGISRPSFDSTEAQFWTFLGNIQPAAVPVVAFVDSEQMLVLGSAVAGAPLGVTRAAAGTTGAVHAAGATVYLGTSAQFGALTPSGSCSGTGIEYVNTSLLQIYSCVAGTLVASASNQNSSFQPGIASPNGNTCSNTPTQAPAISWSGTIYTCQSGHYAPIAGTSSGTLTGLTAGTGLTGGGTSGNVPVSLAPAAIGTIGGVQALAQTAHQWIDSINTSSGLPHTSQPASTDLSDVASIVKLTTSQALTNKDLTDPSNVFPVLNQNTTGNAATATSAGTATALAATPTQAGSQRVCAGIAANGNCNAVQVDYSWLSGTNPAMAGANLGSTALQPASPALTGTPTLNGSPFGPLVTSPTLSGDLSLNPATGVVTINKVAGQIPGNLFTQNAPAAGIMKSTGSAVTVATPGVDVITPSTQQSQFANSIPTSAPYTPCTQGVSPNLTFAGIPYVCSGTAYVANPGAAVGSLLGAAQGTASSTTLRDITSTADQGMLPSASNNVTAFNATLALAAGAGSGVLIPCGNNFTGTQYTFTGPIDHIPSSTSLSMPGGRNGCTMVGNPSAAVTTAPGFLDLHGNVYNSIMNARIATVQSTGGFTFPTTLFFERTSGNSNTGGHLLFNSAILGYNAYATIYSISSETNNSLANTFYQHAPNVPVLYLSGADDFGLCSTYSSNCQTGHVSNLSHFSFGDSYAQDNAVGGDAIKDNLSGGGIGHHNYISDYTFTSAGAAIGLLGSVTGGVNSSINWWGIRSEYGSTNNNYGIHLESNTTGLAAYPGGGSPAGVACTVGQSYQYQGIAYACPSGTLVFTVQSSIVGSLNMQGNTFADPTMIGCLYGDPGVALTTSRWAGNVCGAPTLPSGLSLDIANQNYFSLQEPLTIRSSAFNNIYEMLGNTAAAKLPANNEIAANPVQLGNGIGTTKLYSGGGEIIGLSGLTLSQITNVPVPTMTQNVTGSTTCAYQVVALSAEWTTVAGRTLGTAPTTPPSNCASTPNVTLTFTGAALATYNNFIAPNAIGGYEIYRSISGGSYLKITPTPFFPTPGAAFSFTDNNLPVPGIGTATLGSGGTGSYIAGNVLTVIQSGASGGTVTVTAASGGVITAISATPTTVGVNYSTASGLAVTGGGGTGATINITSTSVAAPIINTTGYLSVDCGTATNKPLAVCTAVGNTTFESNGNLIASGTNQNLIGFKVTTPSVAFSGTAPTIANGAGAGTSPGTPTITGTNQAGFITVITGTSPTSSATLATIMFNSTLATAPQNCTLMSRNSNAASAQTTIFATQPTTTAWTIATGGTPLTPSSTYSWGYSCF